MDHEEYKTHVAQLKIGKSLPDALYIHKRALAQASKPLAILCNAAARALKISEDKWDLVKFFKKEYKLSLLSYPEFDTESYPALKNSYLIDLAKLTTKATSFEASNNPPILHRKELMVSPSDPKHDVFAAFTKEGELAGLYENPFRIGFKRTWERLIVEAGYQLVDGHIVKVSNQAVKDNDHISVERHRTAIVRHELSTPLKLLASASFLDGNYSLFDYGCGRGDDLRELEAHGISAAGWDPNFRPDAPLITSDLVNLGFVINVIEDLDERIEALQRAHGLARKLTVVSAMVAGESVTSKFKPYKDGVLTAKNTFQKYYSQSELKAFIEHTLDEDCIAASPGVFFVFKDKLEEQEYLLKRTHRTHSWNKLSHRSSSGKSSELTFVKYRQLLDDFWLCCLELGRLPAEPEFSRHKELQAAIGSPKKALQILNANADISDLQTAATERQDDLLVYFALALFDRRTKYSEMPAALQRDIKVFFGNYQRAQSEAKEMLFSIASPSVLETAADYAAKALPACHYEESNQLTLHQRYLKQLPPILRIYVGCAAQLFGDLEEIDLIKIHIRSGKVSFMGYEGFETSPLPRLTQRIKVRLRDQDVDYFDYVGPYEPPLLYWKSQLIDPSFADHKKQLSFEKKLISIGMMPDAMNFGPSSEDLESSLRAQGLELRGYRFYKVKS